MRKYGAAAAATAILAVGGGFTALFLDRFRPAVFLLFQELATPVAAGLIAVLAVLAGSSPRGACSAVPARGRCLSSMPSWSGIHCSGH